VSIENTRLLELVEYVSQVASQRPRGSAGVTGPGRFAWMEPQLTGIAGVRLGHDPADHDVSAWLEVARPPHPQLPPTPENPWLAPWLEIGDVMLAAPRLAAVVSGEALITAGTHRDVSAPQDSLGDASMPVVAANTSVPFDTYPYHTEVSRQLERYLAEQWQPWAESERDRRRSSRLYMQLVALHQELTGSASDGQLEVVWGAGLASTDTELHPLIVQTVDLQVDQDSGTISVIPRNADPRLEFDAFPGIERATAVGAERAAADFFANAEWVFSPFVTSTYESVFAAARPLVESSRAAGEPPLEFRTGWALLARPRNSTPLVQDLDRFAAVLRAPSGAPSLPPAVAMLVSDPGTETVSQSLPRYRGISARADKSAETETRDLYFPLPFNDEQMRIVQLLESRTCVTVQGPPGTGKTHTIANIICHWLAHGRRVLVTSMKEPALAVLRDKLPPEIQPLALAMLASDTDGLQVLEVAVQHIAAQVQGLDPGAEASECQRLEEEIDALQQRLSRIDDETAAVAARQLAAISIDDETLDPLDAANEVADTAGTLGWLPDDLGADDRFAPRFDDADLAQLFAARGRLGDDVRHAGHAIAAPESLPSPEALLDAHRRLVRLAQLSAESRATDTPILAQVSAQTFADLKEAVRLVEEVRALRTELASGSPEWLASAAAKLLENPQSTVAVSFDTLANEVDEAAVASAGVAARPVSLPPGAEFDMDLAQAVRNLAAGKRAFGLTTLFRPEARSRLASLTIDEHLPASTADWQHVADALAARARWRALVNRWNALAAELGFPKAATDDATGIPEAATVIAFVRKSLSLVSTETRLSDAAQALFPGWSLARRVREEPAVIRGLERALDHYLNAQQLADVWSVREQLREACSAGEGGVFDEMQKFSASQLGNPEVADNALVDRWHALFGAWKRLHGLDELLGTVSRVTGLIESSGAPKLAAILRAPSSRPNESLMPATWRAGWRARRLASHLAQVEAGPRILELSSQRTEVEHDLTRAYRQLVVKRAWLRLAEQATPGVRSALQAYLSAVQRMGKGAGKRAARYRQDAREAAAQAQAAVPCWIMPHYRISESLPSQFGAFDLVVIDEASQSDLSALPALLRGQRLLIVGDDRQVSPDPIGLEEDRILALMQRHLASQVPIYRMQMSPERSIYDLARVAFAADSVMLKEHFRCVAPIIEYAKREFYGDELRPLRLPARSRRLDPPLIDVYIEGAVRTGDVNPTEADYIVEEIARITRDPNLRGRSVGVVSLLGEEQASAIWDRLADRLGPAVMQAHAIACGDAKAFQGRERDIVFLSMVVTPDQVGTPLSRDNFAQRFNVAASRARDRMVLVRSVQPAHLPESDRLRLGLISHFAHPFATPPVQDGSLRNRCETTLERQLFDWLTSRGYRALPRVQVGTYRIDIVVEGAGDTRMAVECDGDRRLGTAHWLDDIRRQRVLERAGWVFWRCFATRFILDRDTVLAELEAVLASHGIRPMRDLAEETDALTEHRVVSAPREAVKA